MHLGQLVANESTRDKLRRKHHLDFEDVVEAVQWPARARAAWEDHPHYGRRLLAVGSVASGRRVFCVLKPVPDWDEHADTWTVQTARWIP